MADYKPVTHVIFDLDGLLIGTEEIFKEVFSEVLGRYGKEYSDELRLKVLGTQPKDLYRILQEHTGVDVSPEKLREEGLELAMKRMHLAPLMRGAERLIRHLSSNKVPIAIATSSTKASLERKTDSHKDIFALFHHIVAGGSDPEVKQGKPAPDIFILCASRFHEKPGPGQCLVFEDAPNGVQAASSAGMQVIMVPDEMVPAEKRMLATKVLKSLEDFKPEEFGLPPFPG